MKQGFDFTGNGVRHTADVRKNEAKEKRRREGEEEGEAN